MTTPSTSHVTIADRRVGPGHPVLVVAEAGVNHDGSLDKARALIDAAAAAGADAIKFQVFGCDRLTRPDALKAAYQQDAISSDTPGEASESQHAMLARLELPHEAFAELAQHADSKEIIFLATPFSVPDLEFLLTLDIPAIKLASTDVVNRPLLDAAGQSHRPVILSTGAAEADEIRAAVSRLRQAGTSQLALLHCVSSYPTPEAEANLAVIHTLAEQFQCPTGYSDHTESIVIGGYAAAAGACILEKHFTLDRKAPGPDHRFSLEPQALAEYISGVRETEQRMGDGRIGVTERQQEVRRLSRTSLTTAVAIRAGQVITRSMLTAKRPGDGISPMELDAVLFRQAVHDLPANTKLDWDDLSPKNA